MVDFRCLECGALLKGKDAQKDMMKQAYSKKGFLSSLAGKGVKTEIRCLKCGVIGPKNFVCAECGQPHMWKPGKCKRV